MAKEAKKVVECRVTATGTLSLGHAKHKSRQYAGRKDPHGTNCVGPRKGGKKAGLKAGKQRRRQRRRQK